MVVRAATRAVLISIFLCYFTAPAYSVLLRGGLNESKNLWFSEALAPNRSMHLVSEAPLTSTDPPSMFVAIMTKRDTSDHNRDVLRELWHSVDNGTGQICYKFIVCKAEDAHQENLVAEQKAHGDLLLLDCQEGYAQGLLTKKFLATMEEYRSPAGSADKRCLDRELFMKVDDDTFVAAHRFRSSLSKAAASFGTSHMFAGVYSGPAPVARDSRSIWFEPTNVWPPHAYPATMFGGPGYILGKALVQQIVAQNVPRRYMLWNEDKAVGVWINVLEQRGISVNWTHLPGNNGYSWNDPVKSGSWNEYPYALQHHLSYACIACLTKFNRAGNPNGNLHPCFKLDPMPDPLVDEQNEALSGVGYKLSDIDWGVA